MGKVILFLLCSLVVNSKSLDRDPYVQNSIVLNDSMYVFSKDKLVIYPMVDQSNVIEKPIYNELYAKAYTQGEGISYFIPLVKDEQIHFVDSKGTMDFVFENDSIKQVSYQKTNPSFSNNSLAELGNEALFILFGLLLFSGSLWYYKNNSQLTNQLKVSLDDKGILFNDRLYDFEEQELKVINYLMEHDKVNSTQLLKLIENPNHNYSHNMRNKNELIKRINYKFKAALKIDSDVILSEKSYKDKRCIDHRIDKSYFKS